MGLKWGDAKHARVRMRAEVEGPHPVAYVVVLALIAFVAVAAYWAKFTLIDEVTRGEGVVIPSSKVQIIQNLEGGIAEEILVRAGETVKKDQILLRLNAIGFGADLGELETKEAALLATIARLQAEVAGTELTFPNDLMAKAPSVARPEMELFRVRSENMRTQISILNDQMQQRQHELEELQAKIRKAQESYKLAVEELHITEPLAASGVVPKVNLLRLKREVSDLSGEISASKLAVPRAQAALREATERIHEKSLTFRSETQAELNGKLTELAAVQQQLARARDRVERTDIRSPVTGIVKALHVETVGGVIKPGMDIAEIVPLDDTLLVEAKIRPSDVGFLRPSQTATVKFTAYDFSIYGGLQGKVDSISADAIRDEQKDESYYRVVIRTEANSLTHKGRELALMPGMVASVDILTGKRSILSYLLKPILKAKATALTER